MLKIRNPATLEGKARGASRPRASHALFGLIADVE